MSLSLRTDGINFNIVYLRKETLMKPQACHRGNTSAYDDGNIPEIDLPGTSNASRDIPSEFDNNVPKLHEDSRPRQDGPGGN